MQIGDGIAQVFDVFARITVGLSDGFVEGGPGFIAGAVGTFVAT